MMNCNAAQEALLELVDAGQTLETWSPLAGHLAECADCSEFYRVQEQLDRSLATTFQAPELGADFREKLDQRIGRDSMPLWKEFLPEIVQAIGFSLIAVALTLAWSNLRVFFPSLAITPLQVFESSILVVTLVVGFSSLLRLTLDDMSE